MPALPVYHSPTFSDNCQLYTYKENYSHQSQLYAIYHYSKNMLVFLFETHALFAVAPCKLALRAQTYTRYCWQCVSNNDKLSNCFFEQ